MLSSGARTDRPCERWSQNTSRRPGKIAALEMPGVMVERTRG